LLIALVLFNVLCRLQGQPHRACFGVDNVTRLYDYVVVRFSVPAAVADVRAASRPHSQLNWNCVHWSRGYLRYCLRHQVC